ncbi:hypothetical protein C0991_011712 [Blastosporella zonata]|nr:hypothetical protein C0991_011712 [Blastosporella zonata]
MPASRGTDLQKQANLNAYIKNSRIPQDVQPLVTSQEIRDRGSIFIANLFPATSPNQVRTMVAHLKDTMHRTKPATHEIVAWRCMVLKPGRTGLGGPDDFELNVGYLDDGEKWAGAKIQKVMESHAIIDAVVIVSRWYGGMLLGPARFSHIETCTTEVCQEFKRSEELRECISDLTNLDAVLAALRTEYTEACGDKTVTSGSSTPKDYPNLDLEKAKRLVKARENAIKSVKLLLAKRRDVPAAAGSGDPT